MSQSSFRRPTPADAQAVLHLMVRVDVAEYGKPDSDIEDVLHDWETIDLQRDAWLAFEGDRLLGYAAVLAWGQDLRLHINTEPMLTDQALFLALLARCEARCREIAAGRPVRVVCHVGHANARDRVALLETGFERARYHLSMRIDLSEPVPAPRWPPGITLRTAVPGQDERPLYELIESAFARPDRSPQSFQDWRTHLLRADLFDPSLWFLAIRPDDKLVGAALCVRYPSIGWVRQLAVADGWRQRGIGTALLLHAFSEFKRLGEHAVGLGVAGDNPNAYRLYEKAGMRRARQYDEYRKALSA